MNPQAYNLGVEPLKRMFPSDEQDTASVSAPQPAAPPATAEETPNRDWLLPLLRGLSTLGKPVPGAEGFWNSLDRRQADEAKERRATQAQAAIEQRQKAAKDREVEDLRSSVEAVDKARVAGEEGSTAASDALFRAAGREIRNPVVAKEFLDIRARRAKRGREGAEFAKLEGLIQQAQEVKSKGGVVDDVLLNKIADAQERTGRNASVSNHVIDYLVGGTPKQVANAKGGEDTVVYGKRGEELRRFKDTQAPKAPEQAKLDGKTLGQIGALLGTTLDPRVVDVASLEKYHPGGVLRWQANLKAQEEAKHRIIRQEKLADMKTAGADILSRQQFMLTKRSEAANTARLAKRAEGFAGAYTLLDQLEGLLEPMAEKGFLAKGPNVLQHVAAAGKRMAKPGDEDLVAWMAHSGTAVAIQRMLGDIGPRAMAAYEGFMKVISSPTSKAGAAKAFSQMREALKATEKGVVGKPWAPWPGLKDDTPTGPMGMLQPGNTREELPSIPVFVER